LNALFFAVCVLKVPCHVVGSTRKQQSVSSSGSAAAGTACDDVTAVIPDVVIHSADALTDDSRAPSTTVSAEVGRDDDQPGSALAATPATTGAEPLQRARSHSTGDLSTLPVNSRSLPHLPFVAAVNVPDGHASREFNVDPVSRRSLSSLQLAGVRTWCDRRGRLLPGSSLSSVVVETALTSSASSAGTTAGGDPSVCVADSFDEYEVARPCTPPPTRHLRADDRPPDAWSRSNVVSGLDNECHCPGRSSSLSACEDQDFTVDQRRQRLLQQRRQRQFRRRQRRVATEPPSYTSLDELQRTTPPKLVQSSASVGEEDALKSTVGDTICRPTTANSTVVDLSPLLNGTAAATRTARSTVAPVVDGGLRLPDNSTLRTARSLQMTTSWVANRGQTAVCCAPHRARNAWSKSQEIHPKTGGGVCSLKGSASATLISVRRRSSLHAVFVEDPRTAVLKNVVNCYVAEICYKCIEVH